MARFQDNSDEFGARLFAGVGDGAIRAARKLRTFARRKANVRYHFNKTQQKRANKTGARRKTTGASKPGEPPKRRSGKGRESIEAVKIRTDQDIARGRKYGKGNFAKTYSSKRKSYYMSMYEYAPADIQRPWLAPALAENRAELYQIMITPVRRKIRRGGRKAK